MLMRFVYRCVWEGKKGRNGGGDPHGWAPPPKSLRIPAIGKDKLLCLHGDDEGYHPAARWREMGTMVRVQIWAGGW